MPFEQQPIPTTKEITEAQFYDKLRDLIDALEKLLMNPQRKTINDAIRLMNQVVMYAETIDRNGATVSEQPNLIWKFMTFLGQMAPVFFQQPYFLIQEDAYFSIITAKQDLDKSIDTITGGILNRTTIEAIVSEMKELLP